VDTHLLRTFVTVASLGSFSAAAAELGYTQAAISQQVAALESDLKVPLLNRRPVTPTEPGARLLEHAAPILLRLDAARADITRMASAPAAGTLTIGVTPLAGATPALATALAVLRHRVPRLAVTIRTSPRAEVPTQVARGDLDIGLIDGLAAPSDPLPLTAPVSALGVTDSEVAVILPPGHPLAGRPGLRLPDLADARWIDAPEIAPLADIERMSGVQGFRPALHYQGTDTLTLLNLVTAAHGLTLLPVPSLLDPGITTTAITTTAIPTTAFTTTAFTTTPVTAPRVTHRVELIHGTLRPNSPAAHLAALLSPRQPPTPHG
jgi:DNA-binding transcriptional LysR family regulator